MSTEKETASALDELGVGARLKALRKRAGLSQRALADTAGVSGVTISMIEQGKNAPSVVTLHRILGVMSMGLSEFFDLPETTRSVAFTEPTDLVEVLRGSVTSHMLPDRQRAGNLQMFREVYAEGATTGPEWIVHRGETAGMVLAGSILVEADDESTVVETGGGFHILADTPYRLTNAATGVSTLICACSPAM